MKRHNIRNFYSRLSFFAFWFLKVFLAFFIGVFLYLGQLKGSLVGEKLFTHPVTLYFLVGIAVLSYLCVRLRPPLSQKNIRNGARFDWLFFVVALLMPLEFFLLELFVIPVSLVWYYAYLAFLATWLPYLLFSAEIRKQASSRRVSDKTGALGSEGESGHLAGKRLWFLVFLGFMILLGASLRMYRLGEIPFHNDERYQLEAAYGYVQSGAFLTWDFQHDARAQYTPQTYNWSWPYSWQLAQVFHFIGVNEWSARLVSLWWAILFIPLAMLFAWQLTRRLFLAIVFGLLVAWQPVLLQFSQTVRGYSMLTVLCLLFVWTAVNFLQWFDRQSHWWDALKKFEFYTYVFCLAIFGGFAYQTHEVSIILSASFIVWLFVWWVSCLIRAGFRPYWQLTVLIVILILAGLWFWLEGSRTYPVTLNIFHPNFSYLYYVFRDWRWPWLALGMFFIGLVAAWRKYRFLVFATIFSLLTMVYVADRYASAKYGLFFLIIAWFLVIVGLYEFVIMFVRNFSWLRARRGSVTIVALGLFILSGPWLSLPTVPAVKGLTRDFLTDATLPEFQDPLTAYSYVGDKAKAGEIVYIRVRQSYYLQGQVYEVRTFPNNFDDFMEALQAPGGQWFLYPSPQNGFVPKAIRNELKANCSLHKKISKKTHITVWRCPKPLK